ncbi:hypothetical protein [Pediococcus pentosaceus]|uniref:DUF669 domain-containing protein n=1 Tax=Pediococcus pentosaceus TaxID=1255 RepID=A0ABD7X9J7_PEDPE|nr:hypothetical protein [Pediococcus pentosaceus]WEA58302.1 hypothetical protein PWB86_09850 [Pediococcus pentosaceus]
MTRDELNEILKEDNLELDEIFDGIDEDFFIVRAVLKYDSRAIVYSEFKFASQGNFYFSIKALQALSDYANTPIEERKPKPQLYNIIIAEDVVTDGSFFTAWQKENGLGEYSVNSCAEQHDLLHDDDFKFTVEEIEDLKSKVSEKQKQIIDIGIVEIEETMPAKIDTKAVPF